MHRAEADTAILAMGPWASSSPVDRIFTVSEVTPDSCYVIALVGSDLTSSFFKELRLIMYMLQFKEPLQRTGSPDS